MTLACSLLDSHSQTCQNKIFLLFFFIVCCNESKLMFISFFEVIITRNFDPSHRSHFLWKDQNCASFNGLVFLCSVAQTNILPGRQERCNAKRSYLKFDLFLLQNSRRNCMWDAMVSFFRFIVTATVIWQLYTTLKLNSIKNSESLDEK